MTPEMSAAVRSPASRDWTSMGGAGLSGAAGVPARAPSASADRRSAKKSCNLEYGIALPGADSRTLADRSARSDGVLALWSAAMEKGSAGYRVRAVQGTKDWCCFAFWWFAGFVLFLCC